MKIESTDQDIGTMLSSAYYRIPRFQRPYSWDRENIQEFWDDIVRDNPNDYFIGSIVVYKDGNQRFGVVDGQQRLTTITILLCVLRNKLAELGFKNLAEGIHGLVEKRNIDNKPEYIVSTESSYPYFQDYIQKWGKPSIKVEPFREEESLQSAYERLRDLVAEAIGSLHHDTTLTDAKRLELSKEKLVAMRDALLNLKVIFIKLEEEDDAYVIFETLNTRGKDLRLADLVKNHLAKHLKSRNPSSDQAKIKWERMLETIEGSSAALETDTFIHHFWLSKYDYLPAKSLFKVIKKGVTGDEAQLLLDALEEDSLLYRAIHEVLYGKWSKQEARIAQALDALVLFRVQQQVPCVLSLVREYKATQKIKKRHFEDAIVAIEKFHFLFTAATSQRSSGGISGMYAALGRRLYEAKSTHAAVEVIRDLKQKLRDRVPSWEEVKALFPNIVYTDNVTKQRKLVKYILVGLERQVPSPKAIDYNQMTIEHLVPQNMIGVSGYTEGIVGQVGNLMLVPEHLNAKLDSKSFKEKKKILVDGGVVLGSDLGGVTDLAPAEIVKRTVGMADDAYNKVWKI